MKSGKNSMRKEDTTEQDLEHISEIQFDTFWMSVNKKGESLLMTVEELKSWSKFVWNKSRELEKKQ